jgi:hypothetical protein
MLFIVNSDFESDILFPGKDLFQQQASSRQLLLLSGQLEEMGTNGAKKNKIETFDEKI